MPPKQRMLLAITVVTVVYIVGTIGYVILQDCTLFDALYMTAITLSTVGFNETFELGTAGRVWTMVVITLGIAGVSFAISSFISMAVEGDLKQMLGRRKLQATIGKLKGHVILCGYGRMGTLTLKSLQRRNVEVVVVEKDEEQCRNLREDNVPHIQGNATEEVILLEAGLADCGALVAALPTDADNVYITLTARGIRPELIIVARAELPSTEPKLKRAGATRVICPQIVGADKITNILTRPNVVDFFEVEAGGISLEMDEFVIGSNSPLCDATIHDAPIREIARATVVAVKRQDGETIYQPELDMRMRQGDTLILIGETGVSDRLSALA